MDKKDYTLSEVIDFVTNGRDPSNVDIDEEETVILPPFERAEVETDCDSDISVDENEGLAHHMPCHLLTAPCSTNTVKHNLDESNQTSDDESYEQLPKRQKQNKKERKWKKADTDSADDIADPNGLPAELSDSIKTLFDAFWNIYSDDLLDIITTQTHICANQHKGLNPPATSEEIKIVISICYCLVISGYLAASCTGLRHLNLMTSQFQKQFQETVFERSLVIFTFEITSILTVIVITRSDPYLTF